MSSCQMPQGHPTHCGCAPQGTKQVSSAWLAQLREEYLKFASECDRLARVEAGLRTALQTANDHTKLLIAERDALQQRCREANNLADQWAEKNEQLAQRCRELEEDNARVRDHSQYVAEGANRIGAALTSVRESLGLPLGESLLADLVPAIDALRAEVERLRQGTLRIEIARHIAPADRWHWAVVLPSGHVFAVGESFASPELCVADAALAGVSTLHAAKNAIEANQ